MKLSRIAHISNILNIFLFASSVILPIHKTIIGRSDCKLRSDEIISIIVLRARGGGGGQIIKKKIKKKK
jgi:hypothetical protein